MPVSSEYDVLIYHFKSLDREPVNCEFNFKRPKDVKVSYSGNEINVEG